MNRIVFSVPKVYLCIEKVYLVSTIKNPTIMRLPRIKFVFDRKKKSGPRKRGIVDMRVGGGKQQKIMSTGISVLPRQWDAVHECVKGCKEAPDYNRILVGMKQKATKILANMSDRDEIDLDRLAREMQGHSVDMTFEAYIIAKTMKSSLRANTIKSYQSFINTFQEWGGMRLFSDITEKNIWLFDEWLRTRKKMKQSTIWSYHKRLKHFIAMAVLDECVKSNPYVEKHITFDKGAVEHIDHLTQDQLTKVESLSFETGYLQRTRDLFLFQCYTGLAYADLQSFDKDDYSKNEQGVWFGRGNRVKTNTEFSVVLSDKAVSILDKYDWKLPTISNQKYNQYLKVIGGLIGISNLHSHMGRATFATVMLNRGVSTDILQRLLGHKTDEQTKRYATMQDSTIINAVLDKK